MTERVERLAESGRIEGFSDGVFAIAITLLVLDLRVPDERGGFAHQLGHEWPSYVAYFAAFAAIGVVWLTHHGLFTWIDRVDTRLTVLNLGHLLLIGLVPFPTKVMSSAMRYGDHHDQFVAIALFAGLGLAVSVSWYVVTSHVRRHPELLVAGGLRRAGGELQQRELTAMLPGAASIPLALWSPVAALLLNAVTPALYFAGFRTKMLQPNTSSEKP